MRPYNARNVPKNRPTIVDASAAFTHKRAVHQDDLRKRIERFLRTRITSAPSPKTIRWYRMILERYADYCETQSVDWRTAETLMDFITDLMTLDSRYEAHPKRPNEKGGLSIATIRGYGRGLRAFFNWCVEWDVVESNPMERVKLPRQDEKIPKAAHYDDFVKMIGVAVANASLGRLWAVRSLALLLFIADTGVRAGEVADLRFRDVDLENHTATVTGKGRKQRIVLFRPLTANLLQMWLDVRAFWLQQQSEASRDKAEDWYFIGFSGRGKMTPCGISQALEHLAKIAGVQGPFRAHAWRHMFGGAWMSGGKGDIVSLQRLMGHSSPDVTQGYIAFAMEDLRSKHSELSPVARFERMRKG